LFARLYDSAGNPLGTEFQVNTNPACGISDGPKVDASGDFLVVWQTGCANTGEDIAAQRVDSTTGGLLGTEFVINTHTTGYQFGPSVSRTPAGFVVVWADHGFDTASWSIIARRLDGTGAPLGSEIQVSTETGTFPRFAYVAADAAGAFLVTWSAWTTQDGYYSGVVARRFDENDQALAPEILVNTYTPYAQDAEDVVADGDGSFVVLWDDGRQHLARRLDSGGSPVGTPFEIPTSMHHSPYGGVRDARLLSNDGAGFTVVWSDYDPLRYRGTASDVYVQRFACDDAGTDGDGDGLSDACDPCPSIATTSDGDVDCIVDASDNCPKTSNSTQADGDADTVGDACDLCDPGDDSIDIDADDVGDCADLCVNVGGAQNVSDKSSLRFKFINNTVGGDDRFAFKGELTLPTGVTFDSIDPLSLPVTIRVDRSDGFTLFERTLETAAYSSDDEFGWTVNGPGTKWTFSDKSFFGQAAGIVRVNVQDRSNKAPGLVRVQIKGDHAIYGIAPGDEPHKVIVQLGVTNDSCGETSFVANECRYTALDTTLSCKR
jgi:hypothetical protein